jgi:hypothetical protein
MTEQTLNGLGDGTFSSWLMALGALRCGEIIGEHIRLRWDGDVPVFESDRPLVDVLDAAVVYVTEHADQWTAALSTSKAKGRVLHEASHVLDEMTALCRFAGITDYKSAKPASENAFPTIHLPKWANNAVGDKNPSVVMENVIWSAQVLLPIASEKRWGYALGQRKLLRPEDWKSETGSSAMPNTAANRLNFVIDTPDVHAQGLDALGSKSGSTPVKVTAPDLTFLSGLGMMSIPAYGGRMPGQGYDGNRTQPVALRPMWTQWLSLESIGMLAWHPGLTNPRQASILCGRHPSPVRWVRFRGGSATDIDNAPTRSAT